MLHAELGKERVITVTGLVNKHGKSTEVLVAAFLFNQIKIDDRG